ncbi:RteC protein [Pedobacter steynii]|uniref:RteC protein n=1 Tax=Pedobacter steynii TaxID=430522 RepID=A0A1G9K3T3_9SPHI|nr:RteC domain-containing protein [Pedobacter steynii]NQX38443.1 RteC domain-containing protein [Pedobacter steynii]SDL44560.1 RteC protein [Pedobacter steynii]
MNEDLKIKAMGVLAELMDGLAGVPIKDVLPRERLSMQLVLIGDAQSELEVLFDPGMFDDSVFGVFYFKEVYVQLKGLQLYYHGFFVVASELPVGPKERRKYLLAELAGIDRFFLRYQFHYGYYCLGALELDDLLFSIGGLDEFSVLCPLLPMDVPEGVPQTAYLFALFLAKERLRADLLGMVAALDSPPVLSDSASVTEQGDLHTPFQWTSEVVHLIELAHALHLKGVVNDGETGIMEFFEGLGDFFGVNLGVPKRGFEDLKARKRLSKTHFTDSLREALLKKMSDTDAWVGGGLREGR